MRGAVTVSPPLLGLTSPTPAASQAVGDQIVKGALAQLVVAGGMRAAVQRGSQMSRTHGLLASSPVCGHPVRPGHGHAPVAALRGCCLRSRGGRGYMLLSASVLSGVSFDQREGCSLGEGVGSYVQVLRVCSMVGARMWYDTRSCPS